MFVLVLCLDDDVEVDDGDDDSDDDDDHIESCNHFSESVIARRSGARTKVNLAMRVARHFWVWWKEWRRRWREKVWPF